ncbi:PepSY domain-containing protein [Alkalihalobacillus hwajinpoensis]|uniref:PepSY domain-containing protein n=1 Tax=Guptibacillus hwajinpoensis TaxID=208199 RepID=UPI00188342B3|nr:PepSY domain-containing protein [Pseudalkalibacillus hwajinpoensis]MBF0707567.1 PepSY domain-containing protein [Pseudalkalibacillus hwajinpoensis]
MNMKKTLIIGGTALGIAGGALLYQGSDGIENVLASGNNESKLIEEAKISEAEAEKIALEEVSGDVIEKEVEKEDGKIVYEFEIKTDTGEKEVEIDGMSGDIIQVEDDEEDDDKEQKEESAK